MAPLRAHKKSRTGCLQCKKRRVKCDENGHPCGNCAFRNVKCEYPNPSTTASSAEPARPNPVPQQGSPDIPEVHPPVAGLTSPNKLLELMHKFSTETYKSLVSEPSDLHVWQTVIPRRALDHDILIDGILSVAALHTASTLDPPAARPYLDAAMAFQSRALQPFQTAIENISPENCDAVFAYSMLITVNDIAFPRMTLGAATGEPSTVRKNLFLTFELVQGTAEISKLTGSWLKKSSLAPEDFWGSSSEHALDNGTDQALSRLNELNYRENLHWPESFGVIETAISRLRRCFQRFLYLKDVASLLTWLATVDRNFVDSLRRQEALPMLVLVHWGVLLAQLDGKIWWTSNSGAALVSDALGILERETVDFGEAVISPRKQLGL